MLICFLCCVLYVIHHLYYIEINYVGIHDGGLVRSGSNEIVVEIMSVARMERYRTYPDFDGNQVHEQ